MRLTANCIEQIYGNKFIKLVTLDMQIKAEFHLHSVFRIIRLAAKRRKIRKTGTEKNLFCVFALFCGYLFLLPSSRHFQLTNQISFSFSRLPFELALRPPATREFFV